MLNKHISSSSSTSITSLCTWLSVFISISFPDVQFVSPDGAVDMADDDDDDDVSAAWEKTTPVSDSGAGTGPSQDVHVEDPAEEEGKVLYVTMLLLVVQG